MSNETKEEAMTNAIAEEARKEAIKKEREEQKKKALEQHRALQLRLEQGMNEAFSTMASAFTAFENQFHIKLKREQELQQSQLQARLLEEKQEHLFNTVSFNQIERWCDQFQSSNIPSDVSGTSSDIAREIHRTMLNASSFFSIESPLFSLLQPSHSTRTTESMRMVTSPVTSSTSNVRHVEGRLGTLPSTPKIQKWTCFVFYLPNDMFDKEFRTLFARYGLVLRAQIARYPETKESRGYGFVDYAKEEDAIAAIRFMDRYYIRNRYLSVSWKRLKIQ